MNARICVNHRLHKHRRQLVTLGATLLLVLPLVAQADGVVATCSEAVLRAVMAGGGTFTFACNGTITLPGTITIATNTVLDGTGHQVTISGGSAVQVFYVNSGASLSLINLTIANGFLQGSDGTYGYATPGSDVAGGGIYNAGSLRASGCAFLSHFVTGGRGGGGGGAFGWPGLGEPGAPGGAGRGAAIYNAGTLFIQASLFADNTASGGDGGRGGNTINDKTYYSGGAGARGGDGAGGAIFNSGTATLVNCTLTGNVGSRGTGGQGGSAYDENPGYPGGPSGARGADGSGVGAVFDQWGGLSLTNCTVALNSGSVSGGIRTYGASLLNTLLAANNGGNCSGTLTDLGHNLSSDGTCGFTGSGSMNNTDPRLGPLANNGGPTLTLALLPGSPAMDAADPVAAPATDQRGIARPVGPTPDIGAFEYGLPVNLRISGSQVAGLDLFASAYPGFSCRLLSSSNLSDWTPIATNQIASDGTYVFHDNCAPGRTCRFYRVVMP